MQIAGLFSYPEEIHHLEHTCCWVDKITASFIEAVLIYPRKKKRTNLFNASRTVTNCTMTEVTPGELVEF